MSWGNESRNLTDQISAMHEARDNYMNHLRNDIQRKKNNWNEERNNMKADLLAHFSDWNEERKNMKADLLAYFSACDSARAKEVTDLRSSTNAFLKEFRKENKERAQDIAQFKVEVGKMIAGFKKDRDEAVAAWQELLSNIGRSGEKRGKSKEKVKIEKRE